MNRDGKRRTETPVKTVKASRGMNRFRAAPGCQVPWPLAAMLLGVAGNSVMESMAANGHGTRPADPPTTGTGEWNRK